MRETKHTPGPWLVAEGVEGYPDIVTKDGISIIGNEGFYGDFCQDWINAHLVASAPELLEALKHCKEVLTIVNGVDKDLMTKDALERVYSAITKAEGGE